MDEIPAKTWKTMRIRDQGAAPMARPWSRRAKERTTRPSKRSNRGPAHVAPTMLATPTQVIAVAIWPLVPDVRRAMSGKVGLNSPRFNPYS